MAIVHLLWYRGTRYDELIELFSSKKVAGYYLENLCRIYGEGAAQRYKIEERIIIGEVD
jgi:hypothetical protein